MNTSINNSTRALEAKARCKLAWLLNDVFAPFNVCCMDDDDDVSDLGRKVLSICEAHPPLALEHYIVEDTGEKVTPLDAFLRGHVDPKVIKEFCAKFPGALQVKSKGVYPLHTACEEIPPSDGPILIPFLAESFPEAVRTRDNYGNLPIHKVLRRLAKSPSAFQKAPEVDALLRIYPESTVIKGLELMGQDPCHFVVSHRFSETIINMVLSRVPENVGLNYVAGLLRTVQANESLRRKDQEKVSISYNLLREAPSLWACAIMC